MLINLLPVVMSYDALDVFELFPYDRSYAFLFFLVLVSFHSERYSNSLIVLCFCVCFNFVLFFNVNGRALKSKYAQWSDFFLW